MQRFYGLNLDYIGVEFSYEHAAACVACLGVGSSLFARQFPEYQILIKDLPIKAVLDAMRGDKPPDVKYGAMSVSEFDKWLKSKEVN